jgi:hypothetical protein
VSEKFIPTSKRKDIIPEDLEPEEDFIRDKSLPFRKRKRLFNIMKYKHQKGESSSESFKDIKDPSSESLEEKSDSELENIPAAAKIPKSAKVQIPETPSYPAEEFTPGPKGEEFTPGPKGEEFTPGPKGGKISPPPSIPPPEPENNGFPLTIEQLALLEKFGKEIKHEYFAVKFKDMLIKNNIKINYG